MRGGALVLEQLARWGRLVPQLADEATAEVAGNAIQKNHDRTTLS